MTLNEISPAFAISSVCLFLLKTGVGYLFCGLLARLATSAGTRFFIWLGYLVGSAVFLVRTMYLLIPYWSTSTETTQLPSAPALSYTLSSSAGHYVTRLMVPMLLCYSMALTILSLVGVWKRICLARALRYRSEPPSELTSLFAHVTREIGAPPTTLWLLDGLATPAALGWLRPAVYLPPECVRETEAELISILRHELAHVRRRDDIWEHAARFCRWILFFHPLAYQAFNKLRLEREIICDMIVVQTSPERRDLYAETLIRFGWKTMLVEHPDHVGIGFTSQANVLNARITSILKGKRIFSKWNQRARASAVLLVSWLFVFTAPMVWVGFISSYVPPTIADSFAGSTTLPIFHASRRTRAKIGAIHENTIDKAPSPAAAADWQQMVTAPNTKVWHVQNEDEPMSNPVLNSTSADQEKAIDGPDPGLQNGSRRIPSASSTLINAATTLARMGLGGDHDDHH